MSDYSMTHDSNAWVDSRDITELTQTITFPTEEKYIDKNIVLQVNVPGINLTSNSTFYIDDGITTWNWTVDSEGNVTVD